MSPRIPVCLLSEADIQCVGKSVLVHLAAIIIHSHLEDTTEAASMRPEMT